MGTGFVYICCVVDNSDIADEISNHLSSYHINSYISCKALSNVEKSTKLQSMSVMVLLYSKDIINSFVIDNEITEAINNQVPIVPFQLDDTSIKQNLSLDFMLKKSQWVLGYPDKEKQMDNLIVSVCRFMGVDAIEKNPSDPFEQLKRGIALEHGSNGLKKDREEAMLWLHKSAENKNTLAMFELYKFYYNTEDDNAFRDYGKAKFWLVKAADYGLAEAQYILGKNYEVYDDKMAFVICSILPNDISIPLMIKQDYELARKYYIKAAKQGFKKAIFRLGILCLKGPSQMRNKDYAFKFLSAVSDLENDELCIELGRLYKERKEYKQAFDCFKKVKFHNYDLALCYLHGLGTDKNFRKSYDIIFDKKNNNDPNFSVLRGSMYEKGLSVPLNKEKACEYYLEAYEIYSSEKSPHKSEKKAIDMLEKAAQLKNAEATYKLGLYWFHKNEQTEAFRYFYNAALLELPIAYFYVGYCYFYGYGIGEDFIHAYKWLKKSDIPGLPYSTYLLGEMFYWGLGILIDKAKALDCYLRSANQEQPLAERRIYEMYENGEISKKQISLAVSTTEWLKKMKIKNQKN